MSPGSLARLRALVPPPAQPFEPADPARWPDVEQALGTRLPADYKAFVETYGSGLFDGFLYVFNPFSADEDGNLLDQRHTMLGAYEWRRRQAPAELPLPSFPEPGGLLPLGRTQNGDQLHWLTEGEPDRWPVVVFPARVNEHERYDLGVVDFLAGLLGGELGGGTFPADFLAEQPHRFEPG
jgi:hypothetical protein